MTHVPERLKAYAKRLPELERAVAWRTLRRWSLSEVYRITLNGGETRIVKWGGGEMAREASVYTDLLIPLQIRSPRLYFAESDSRQGMLLMEDVGPNNVEQRPEPAHFAEAAKELSRLRKCASAHLKGGRIPRGVADRYIVTAETFLRQLDRLLHASPYSGNPVLPRVRQSLPGPLDRLYRSEPMTIVHHDYHAKNWVVQNGRIMPVDWSNAYLSPHLGDLYRLAVEANDFCGVPRDAVLNAYLEELAQPGMSAAELKRQTAVGGLCWLIRSLYWLANGGTNAIPGSDGWIPDLIGDMEPLCEELP
ncbi:phosphotransferase [Paenibacillus sp. GYB003]|uniref:phosphotransferase n=1 Tax=Paenibacillus sp. GYB003 TaxID=2994392 RepID=UPI002F96D69F